MALKYRLTFELHFLDVDGDARRQVRTHRRWDCVNGTEPRSMHEALTDGVLTERRYLTGPTELDELSDDLAILAETVAADVLTDDQARQHITAATDAVPLSQCPRQSCGAPVPIGSDRCADWDSIGQSGAGSLTGLRGRPTLILRTGNQP